MALTGNITTQNLVPAGAATAGSALELIVQDAGGLTVQITGTYTGALSVQATIDGTNWFTTSGGIGEISSGTRINTIPSGGTGLYQVNVAGFYKVRITALAAVTGTAVVQMQTTDDAGIFFLTNSGGGGSTFASRVTATLTTEQLRAAYDASNYMSVTVGSTGSATLDLTGTSPTFTFGKSVIINGGSFQNNSTSTSATFYAANQFSTQSVAAVLFAGAAQVKNRAWFAGSSNVSLAANDSYANLVISGGGGTTGASSGTHAFGASLVVKGFTFTPNATTPAAMTNAASMYIDAAPTGATNNYALYVAAGTSKMVGKVWGGAGTNHTHEFDYSDNIAANGVWGRICNSTNSGYAAWSVGTNASANALNFYSFGTTYLSAGAFNASQSLVEATASLYLKATDFRFHTGPIIVNGGTSAPNAAALMELVSTTKGLLLPRMTTTQRDAISSPPSGLVIFNSTTNKINVRGASAWEAVTSA